MLMIASATEHIFLFLAFIKIIQLPCDEKTRLLLPPPRAIESSIVSIAGFWHDFSRTAAPRSPSLREK